MSIYYVNYVLIKNPKRSNVSIGQMCPSKITADYELENEPGVATEQLAFLVQTIGVSN